MNGGESILDAILDDDYAEEYEDTEMVDVEEGEFVEENLNAGEGEKRGFSVEGNLNAGVGEKSVSDVTKENQESGNVHQTPNKNKQKKRNRKNRKRNHGGGCPGGIDVNRFVMDVCSRLGEKRSYLIYSAVGCLGVSALNDIVNEVYAIQACGGQKISGGAHLRHGGGILWNILRTRDPNAFEEIMKKGRDFEKQFIPRSIKREPAQPSTLRSSHVEPDIVEQPERSKAAENHNNEPFKFTGGKKGTSIHDRLRVPVSYSDILGEENLGNEKVLEREDFHDERPSSSPSVI